MVKERLSSLLLSKLVAGLVVLLQGYVI